MMQCQFDAIVIGGGAAGMAAALVLDREGYSVAILEREDCWGGILNQCIHNGFGLHRHKKELTGPEYAEEDTELLFKSKIARFLQTTAVSLTSEGSERRVIAYSPIHGVMQITAKAVILAMGCRERNRGNIGTSGFRPAGLFTAGLAQRLVNIEGYLPGRSAVIVGSGDIGLIMARRLTWAGCQVRCVVEILPYPAGLTRNVVQCLQDFDIPLYLHHSVVRINGLDRVESVDIAPIENGQIRGEKSFREACDAVLFSVGLVPENELSQKAGVQINPDTNGPLVGADLQTSVKGVFACGNVLHVHDLVDFVSEEGERCGNAVARFLREESQETGVVDVRPVANVKYVVPNRCPPGRETIFFLRSLIACKKAVLTVRQLDQIVYEKKLDRCKPAEMIRIVLGKEIGNGGPLEFGIEEVKNEA